MKIRTRIFLCFLAAVAAGFYFLVNWVMDDLRPHYLESLEESLVDTAAILSSLLAENGAGGAADVSSFRAAFEQVGRRELRAQIYDVLKTRVDLRVYVTDALGVVVFDSDGGRAEGQDYSRWNDVHRTLRGEYGARTTRIDPADPSTSVLYVASPIERNGERIGVVTVCKPTANANLFIAGAKRKIILAGTIAAVAALVLGVAMAAWVTYPLQKLTDYAQAVRDGRNVTMPKLGHSEAGTMGRALEEMRQALEGKQYVEKYITTLTHELKGPLSAIRGAAELLTEDMPAESREKFLGNIISEAQRIQRVVDRLLLLSSLEGRRAPAERETFDLRAVVDDVAEGCRPMLATRRMALEIAPGDEGPVTGERFLLRHAVANLLHNAIEFTPEGGSIRIELVRRGQELCVVVEDSGCGIPDYALDRVFERFYSLPRPDTGRKSSGLGLTFVREAAELHGGSIRLENRPEGGARATLCLPG